MNTAMLCLKVALICVLGGGGLILLRCSHNRPSQPLNSRQAAMVDSLKSAAPTKKDLK